MTVTPLLLYGFQEWPILFSTAELLSLKFNLIRNSDYCHHCLVFLLPSRGYSNKQLQAVLNGWQLCCSELEEVLLRQESICVLWGLPAASSQWLVLQFGFIATRSGFWFRSGQALLEFILWATVETSCEGILTCAEQLREFSVNPASLGLTETRLLSEMLPRAHYSALLLCPPAL